MWRGVAVGNGLSLPGFFTLYLYLSHGSPGRVVVTLSAAFAVILPADILRLNWPAFERVYEKCLGFLMRESEKVRYSALRVDLPSNESKI